MQYADMAALVEKLSATKMRVERCPSCGTWSSAPYHCQRCDVESVTQGEYLTRLASGPQPARCGGSEA